jgi:ABC-type dipeptide/oligopeptide/nickel transport system permease subunit
MEAKATTPNQVLYPFKLRFQLWGRNSLDFLRELWGQPSALLGAVLVVLFVLMAIFAPQIAPHDPTKGNLRNQLIPPAWEKGGSSEFLLGTDVQGRDLLSRIIHGARISLWVGILTVGISALVGTTLGAVSGYQRGWLDALISRFAELLMAFPFLIFAIGMMAFLGPGFANLLLALTLKSWVVFFRLARGAVMAEKTVEYVEAAKVVGQSNPVIIISEILPNIFHSILVLGTLRMGSLIITEASLSFLGLGIQPPTPAWGSMVASGRDYLVTNWWIATLPGLAILILVLSINLFGEGLRDILDPRLKVE